MLDWIVFTGERLLDPVSCSLLWGGGGKGRVETWAIGEDAGGRE